MPDQIQTITADKLAQLTGLTDRRHRQLADAGWFPLPEKGQYKLVPTLQGMFRYYRDLQQRKNSELAEQELRNEKLDGDIKEIRKQILQRDNVPAAAVQKVWGEVMSTIRNIVMISAAPEELKKDLLDNMRNIPTDDYFRDIKEDTEEDAAAVA